MAPKDKLFYQQLGQRIAQFRKAQNLTQQQLADLLGVAQQTLAHYEMGRLRIAVAALPPLAEALVVSVEELLEDQPAHDKRKRGAVSKLQRQGTFEFSGGRPWSLAGRVEPGQGGYVRR